MVKKNSFSQQHNTDKHISENGQPQTGYMFIWTVTSSPVFSQTMKFS